MITYKLFHVKETHILNGQKSKISSYQTAIYKSEDNYAPCHTQTAAKIKCYRNITPKSYRQQVTSSYCITI